MIGQGGNGSSKHIASNVNYGRKLSILGVGKVENVVTVERMSSRDFPHESGQKVNQLCSSLQGLQTHIGAHDLECKHDFFAFFVICAIMFELSAKELDAIECLDLITPLASTGDDILFDTKFGKVHQSLARTSFFKGWPLSIVVEELFRIHITNTRIQMASVRIHVIPESIHGIVLQHVLIGWIDNGNELFYKLLVGIVYPNSLTVVRQLFSRASWTCKHEIEVMFEALEDSCAMQPSNTKK